MKTLEARYAEAFPDSARLAERARALCPGGVSQVFRETRPFPLACLRAAGARKQTVDGVELVDCCMGHGALIFGHGDPGVAEAVRRQLERGCHFGAPSEAEVELAALVVELVPSAERVRFTGTGSEACALALRLARAATGRERVVKFQGHYHGWHDQALIGLRPPFDRAATAGVPAAARDAVVVLPPGDLALVEQALDAAPVACVVVEPAGGTHGVYPTSVEWIRGLREVTRRRGALLVFDEMVSGFRLAPGGYQAWSGVTPDLTTLGKTLFGGLPGGALAGRAALMGLLAAGADRFVAHYGTWNAFPVACAAGVEVLRRLRDGRVQQQINAAGASLRAGLAAAVARRGVAAHVYGTGSHAHVLLRSWPFDDERVPPARLAELANDPDAFRRLRLAMALGGVDFEFANNLSTAHGPAELDAILLAFDRALGLLVEEGAL